MWLVNFFLALLDNVYGKYRLLRIEQKSHNQSHTSGVVPGFVVVQEVAENRTDARRLKTFVRTQLRGCLDYVVALIMISHS